MIAISSACKEALIGLEINGKRAFRSLDSNCKHSENMLFTIDQMLDEIGEDIKKNDSYAVIIGPGSFTGLRIGVALIKGLCAGESGETIVPLTTFDLMAYSYIKNFAPQENFTCIINGLSGYYFVCEYSAKGIKLSEEKMITKEQLALLEFCKVGLEEDKIGDIQLSPTAEELLDLAQINLAKSNTTTAQKLEPMYLRKSQAESGLEGK